MLFENISLNTCNLVIKRFRRQAIFKSWPNDWVPFHWSRPVKVPGYRESGDLVDLGEADPSAVLPEMRASNELKRLDINDPIRKILSVSHNPRASHKNALALNQVQKLGLIHQVDHNNSLESKIIRLTYSLRHFLEVINYEGEKGRYNSLSRSRANSLLYRRYRYLCELKEMHNERFERIKNLLAIEPKDNPINVPFERPYRKKQMRRLALEYARSIKERKVEEFMESLEKEKVDFEKEKTDTLKWIGEQEEYLSSKIDIGSDEAAHN